MKFDTTLLATDLSEIPQLTRQAEVIGFDGIWVSETAHDPFLPLVLVAEHSERLTLGTGIALAFPRSPAVLAYMAWDLAKYAQGRFVLGLGTQVNNHFQ
jgi:alkanesulfonate monooxygenase SsuD/methylene tetrahydromethanopterin reductase-like flavin-dependent oxidoreductase (luciferase family)